MATGAAYHALHWPARMGIAIRDAFVQARREQRPVVLGVPFDLQDLEWEREALPAPSSTLIPNLSPIPPHQNDVKRAVDLVAEANKIVLIAGMGALHAGGACRDFAASCDALLATTLPARGLFHDDPFSIGIAGGFSSDIARECLGEADLVIAVGCSLAKHTSDAGKLWPKASVLQIDVDPVVISQGRIAVQYHLRADARLGVEALISALPKRPAKWRSARLAQDISERPADVKHYPSEADIHDPRDAVDVLDKAIPQDWELVNSSGHCSYFFAQMPKRPQAQFLTIREFGAIGNGISFAMGVALARLDIPIVLFDGDGSLLMHIQELETIRRHNMNILIVVFNDGAYGSEIYKLRAEGLSDVGAVFGRTDFAAVARGFGIEGDTITDLADIPAMIAEFSRKGGAAVWDIAISDQVASPVIRRAHPQ